MLYKSCFRHYTYTVYDTITDCQFVMQEESDVIARSEFILDHMQRRASLDMAYFCQALDDTAQHHVVTAFLQKPTNADKPTASNDPANV